MIFAWCMEIKAALSQLTAYRSPYPPLRDLYAVNCDWVTFISLPIENGHIGILFQNVVICSETNEKTIFRFLVLNTIFFDKKNLNFKSGHIYMKDAEFAETNKKSVF